MVFSDDLALHILELPKFGKKAEEVTNDLDRWLYFLRHAEDMDAQSPPSELQTPILERAIKELTMLTQDQLERERYEARLKLHRDELTRFIAAKEEGREEGERNLLIKWIRKRQELLGQPISSIETLQEKSVESLQIDLENLDKELSAFPSKKPEGENSGS